MMLLLLLIPLAAGALTIPKCCGPDQHLDMDDQCVDNGEQDRDLTSEPWWWIPVNSVLLADAEQTTEQLVLETLDGASAEYNRKPGCGQDSLLDLANMPKFGVRMFRLNISDGQIGLEVLQREPAPLRSLLPAELWCVDGLIENGWLAHNMLACPCRVAPCVRKCCYDGIALQLAGGGCAPVSGGDDDDLGYWRPLTENNSTANGFYMLVGVKPSCSRGVYRIESGFSLLKDGRMKLPMGELLEPSEYCGDHVLPAGTPVLLACSRACHVAGSLMLALIGVLQILVATSA